MGMSFEQQPKESDRAFATFEIYLELGPERSLVRVAEKSGKMRCRHRRLSRPTRTARRLATAAVTAHFSRGFVPGNLPASTDLSWQLGLNCQRTGLTFTRKSHLGRKSAYSFT